MSGLSTSSRRSAVVTFLVRYAWVLLVAYSIFLVFALFSPTSDKQSGAVSAVGTVLDAIGVPHRYLTFDRLEVVANVAIIAPVSFLGLVVAPSFTWRDWTAYAFVAATLVELVQGFLLPDRQASFSDIVANTAGALLGSVLARIVTSGRRRVISARRVAYE